MLRDKLVNSSESGVAANALRWDFFPGDASRLPPFLRVLLATDGTVTKSLEAYFWEPIVVETLQQSRYLLPEPVASLDCRAGDEVILRRVQLRGKTSARCFVEADSLIRFALLPPPFQQALEQQNLGIGELVREQGLETYREILSVQLDEPTGQVARTYRILMANRPIIQITERFWLTVFE